MRGQGLATGAIRRLKEELLLVAGPRFGLVANLASCMRSGGAGLVKHLKVHETIYYFSFSKSPKVHKLIKVHERRNFRFSHQII